MVMNIEIVKEALYLPLKKKYSHEQWLNKLEQNKAKKLRVLCTIICQNMNVQS